jgi:aldehyde dehydrogenase (NAD+)
MWPLISAKQLGRVSDIVRDAAKRCDLRVGSPDPLHDRDGHFFGPVLFDNVSPQDTVAQEEVFGPVCAVSTFDDLDAAAAIANGTKYGLIAAVWNRSGARGGRRQCHIPVRWPGVDRSGRRLTFGKSGSPDGID